MGQLDGKIALITGAGRGIGRAAAELFAAEGARVAVVSRSRAGVDAVVEAIRAAGGTAAGIACDVTDAAQITRAVAETVAAFGSVDILVNNAHDTRDLQVSFLETSDDMLQAHMDMGFFATVRFMRACFPYLKERRGRVINFGSVVGVQGSPKMLAYGAAKEAIRQATRVAAREWGKFGINVNCVCPTAVTDGLADAIRNEPAVANFVKAIPLRRAGDPAADIAPILLFLAGPASGYLTGHTLMADGGAAIDAGR
ncbi:MAG: SDR family oxidoreductase [Alphaproteobacteria bacterium]|nr:SDR family oxidoreductase [Alphaproteobacteria bacterium]